MATHRRVSAKRANQAKRLAVLAFLGLVITSPGLATASAETTESSAAASENSPDPSPPGGGEDASNDTDADDDTDEDADVDDDAHVDGDIDADVDANEDVEEDADVDEGLGTDEEVLDNTDPEPVAEQESVDEATARNDHDASPTGAASQTLNVAPDEVDPATTEIDAPVAPDALRTFSADVDAEDAKSPWDFLPQYPDIAGVTKTEVAAVVFVAAAAVTLVSIPTAPLLTIPLLALTYAAWVRFEDLGRNLHAPTASVANTTRVLGLVTATLIGNDEDGDPVNITLENGPASGSVEIIGTPSLGFQYFYTADNPLTVGAINDSFTIKIDDFGGWRNHPLGMHSVIMTIDVTDAGLPNVGPIVLPVSVGIPDRAGVVRGSVLATDPEGGPLAYKLANGTQSIVTSLGGIVHLDGEDYVYIPSQSGGLLGVILDSFEVTVSDGDDATTTVTVGVATTELDFDYTSVVAEDTVTGEIDAPANDIGLFTYAVGSGPSHGDLTIDPDTGAYTYAAGGSPQNDSFTVVATDVHGNQVTLNVAVSLVAPNRPPTVVPVGVGVGIGGTGIVTGAVLGSDPDSDPLHFSVTGYGGAQTGALSNGGMVVVDSDGKWTYVPPVDGGGFLGAVADDFTIYVTDGRGGQASTVIGVLTHDLEIEYTAVVTGITVAGGLEIPSALADLLTYAKGNGPSKGGVTVDPDGSYEYTSSLTGHGISATDTFTIIGVTADGVQITVATVTVTPELPNQNPTATFAVTGSSSTNLGALSVGSASGRLNVSDPDGDTQFTYVVSGSNPLAPNVGTTAKGGLITVNSDGTFDYTSPIGLPHSSAPAGTTDTFTVTVLDGFGGSAAIVVSVPIVPVNNAPTHVGTTGASGRDLFQKTGAWVTTVADVDLDTVTATVTPTTRGTVSISKTAAYIFTVTYTSFTNPSVPFTRSPSETVTVTYSDGLGGSVTRTYTF